MDNQAGRIAAVIDIGSSGVRMLISQWNGMETEALDYLERPVQLGQEVFSIGYITFETMRELSGILDGFCAAAREYGIARIHATATTAMREAANQAYILDHLAIQNKLKVRVLSDAETGALLFHHLRREVPADSVRTLMVYSGTGTIDFALLHGKQTCFTHSMHTGLLKIADLLQEASEHSLNLGQVASEFLQTFLTRLVNMQDLSDMDAVVFGIGEILPLLRLCGLDEQLHAATLSRKKLRAAHRDFSELSLDQLAKRHDMSVAGVGEAYAALLLLHALSEITGVGKVHCVQCSFAEAFMDLLLRPGMRRLHDVRVDKSVAASANLMCERYGCDRNHVHHVAASAVGLFDKLRKLHGLSRKHRLYLQTACLLHEVGRFSNSVNPQQSTYNMVRDMQLYGVTPEETLLIANIIDPQSLLGIERGDARARLLTEQDVLMAAKMHALLHLADALDFARRQKARRVQPRLEGEQLIVSLTAEEDFTLEKLMFRQSASLFREVFGITPVLELQAKQQMKGTV